MTEEELKAFREKVNEAQITILLSTETYKDHPLLFMQPCDRSFATKLEIAKERIANAPDYTFDIPAGVKQL